MDNSIHSKNKKITRDTIRTNNEKNISKTNNIKIIANKQINKNISNIKKRRRNKRRNK